jgi:hypothetical protein
MAGHIVSDDEIYRELEAIKLRLHDDAADDALARESLWLLRKEIRDLADSLSSEREQDPR